MEIKEINNRGSEIFPMMEKVRGVRHKKKLVGVGSAAATSVLGVSGALLILLCTVVPPPAGGGKGGGGKLPPPVTVSTKPQSQEKPNPEESPTPEPEESPTPEPEESPTPEPEESPTPIYNPPATTTPTPQTSPKLSLSGIYYQSLKHAAVTVKVTANQAVDLTTEIDAMTAGEETIGSTSFSGEGTFRLNGHIEDDENITSPWMSFGVMSYSLDGESHDDEFDKNITPTVKKAKVSEKSSSATAGGDHTIRVTEKFVFSWSGDDVHDYDVRVTGVDIGWMKKTGDTFTTTGNIRDVWKEEFGDSPVTAEVDTAGKKITFTYNDVLGRDIYGPPENGSNATHFYLVFYFAGVGTDTNTDDYEHSDDAVYELAKPKRLICDPIKLSSVAPTISYEHLWYWGEFNAYPTDPGFRLLELQYDVEPNDATDISVDVTISANGQSDTVTWSGVSETGLVSLRKHVDFPFLHSWNSVSDSWKVKLVMNYKLRGVSKSKTLNISPSNVGLKGFGPQMTVSYNDGTTSIDIGSDSDDPFTYSVTGIAKIYFDWYKKSGSNYTQLVSQQVYPGNGTVSPSGSSSAYTYDYALPTEPPSGASQATHVQIRVDTESPYTGTDGSGTETSNGPLTAYSDWIEVSFSSTGSDYLGSGLAQDFEDVEHVYPEGFIAVFPLDLSIVPNASGSTITPLSMVLTGPGGTVDLMTNDQVEYDVVNGSGGGKYFYVRYEPEEIDFLDLGSHTLSVTVSYTSGDVTDLQSSNTCSFTVVDHPPDYGYSIWDPEAWADPIGDNLPAYTELELYYDADSDYTYTATVTSAKLVWSVDGVQSTVTLTPPTFSDDGEGYMTTEELFYNVALPENGSIWKFHFEFTVVVRGVNGSDSFEQTHNLVSNEVTVKEELSGPDHAFIPSVTVSVCGCGDDRLLVMKGTIRIKYNTETGYDYTAAISGAQISFGSGFTDLGTYCTVDSADYSEDGYITFSFSISGYPIPTGEWSCQVQFTADVSGTKAGSDPYETTLNPTSAETGIASWV